ncbi:MAG: dihydrolipoyl dehydrogenase [Rickettsiales bacterium]|nr:MAG: dihydrolipoyl dehydrogenase [Rickettsiales bacterium]
MEVFDVVVIGGGPGGYVAAIRAAQLGKKTAVIEKEHLGGICLNWGCIPTKSLLKSAEMYEHIKHSDEFGLSVGDIKFDLDKIVARSRDVSGKLVKGIHGLLKKNKVTLIEGFAKIEKSKSDGTKQISVNGANAISAKNIIIATGARARILSGFEPNDKNIWSYREALLPKFMPKSIVIVGSGAIGIEFASFYNAFGADVTVLESMDRILPVEDIEISNIARKSFETKGIKFKTGVKLIKQTNSDSKITISFEVGSKEEKIESDVLLMAVGIVGNIENIGLDNTKIIVENTHIVTNNLMQTAENNIYAIGDVAGAPWLAHKSSHEGIIAAENIAGKKPHPIIKANIPGCTYSNPQIASVGLTEDQALKAGYEVKIGRFPSYANAKSLILGNSDGLIKTIFDKKSGEMLGAHMVGLDVTELIQGYVIAKQMEGTEIDLMNTIFPHPTLSEMMHESVLQAYGKQIHI